MGGGQLSLAGEPAHVHGPAGGQGMNLGITGVYIFRDLTADLPPP
ncbi:MAG: FAD-dependent monooxygenase [Mycobacterium sp.]|nr:FAD-dependent monooxygenase [Mycobacterium sp.]